MIVKVHTAIVLDVKDDAQAEQACSLIDSGLDDVIGPSFPAGEVIDAEVDRWERVSDEEIEEKGWSE